MATQTITIELEDAKVRALQKGAGRPVESAVLEAIDAYIDLEDWRIAHIMEGVRQADACEFASAGKVARAFDKWRA